MKLSKQVVAIGLLPAVLSVPTPQMSLTPNLGVGGDIAGVDPTTSYPPTGTSGSLYGNSQLLGENARPSAVSDGNSAVETNYQLVSGQEADPDLGLYLDFNSVPNPQPIRGSNGATDPGPRTYEYDKLNPDIFAPPGTDSGSVDQAMWPFGLSHARSGTGKNSGWARQQNIDNLPSATEMAGVDMRLAPGAYRELHWHTASEWSLVLKGCVRLSAVNENGQTFNDDICAGDIWFFPAGVPHSIQALDEGCEFLLVFDDGSFSEDSTALASELFLRNPKEVLSKTLGAPISAFDDLPKDQLYIFNGTPAPADISEQEIASPAGELPANESYTYHFSQQEPYIVPGGSVKIIDSSTFPIAANFAAALVTIEPGAMHEMHWHLTSDEWNYFISGSGRITVFSAPQSSQTFDYTAGDVGYIPAVASHYIENTGTENLIVLEVLQQSRFTDISVAQWLALTPRQVVMDTLHLPRTVLDALPKAKGYIETGNTNLTALAGDGDGTA